MRTTLIPAYGRDYKNKQEVIAAWEAGQDFIVQCYAHPYDGKPINKPQATKGKYSIRYNKMRKVVNL